MLGLKIGIIKRPRSAPKPVRAGEGRSVIHSARCPLPTGKGSPWQAINPYYYSPLETWKGDEKGNCNENGSKTGGKTPNKNPTQQQNPQSPRRSCLQKHIPSDKSLLLWPPPRPSSLPCLKGDPDFRSASRGGDSPGKRLGSRGLVSCSPRASQADKQKRLGRERGREGAREEW